MAAHLLKAPNRYDFFINKACALSTGTGLTIASLCNLFSWNFEDCKVSSLMALVEEQQLEREAYFYCYDILRKIFASSTLRLNALKRMLSVGRP